MTAAERMRLSRSRRRGGMRVVPFEVRDNEIEGLIKLNLLDVAERNNPVAIARALGTLMNRLSFEWWAAAMRA
jgi:hypothetical protein